MAQMVCWKPLVGLVQVGLGIVPLPNVATVPPSESVAMVEFVLMARAVVMIVSRPSCMNVAI